MNQNQEYTEPDNVMQIDDINEDDNRNNTVRNEAGDPNTDINNHNDLIRIGDNYLT
jgi:hypothetical protein